MEATAREAAVRAVLMEAAATAEEAAVGQTAEGSGVVCRE